MGGTVEGEGVGGLCLSLVQDPQDEDYLGLDR